MVMVPLIRHADLAKVFAYRRGRTIDAAQFLSDVERLTNSLPPRSHILNLCIDRYHFTVGFAAALLKRQVSLLPPNQTPELLGELAAEYPSLIA